MAYEIFDYDDPYRINSYYDHITQNKTLVIDNVECSMESYFAPSVDELKKDVEECGIPLSFKEIKENGEHYIIVKMNTREAAIRVWNRIGSSPWSPDSDYDGIDWVRSTFVRWYRSEIEPYQQYHKTLSVKEFHKMKYGEDENYDDD